MVRWCQQVDRTIHHLLQPNPTIRWKILSLPMFDGEDLEGKVAAALCYSPASV